MLGVYRNFIELISYQGHILLLYFFINTKKNKRKTAQHLVEQQQTLLGPINRFTLTAPKPSLITPEKDAHYRHAHRHSSVLRSTFFVCTHTHTCSLPNCMSLT